MREYTNRILELLEEGFYGEVHDSTEWLIVGLLNWMSEDDVKKFWFVNGYSDIWPEEEEE